MPRGYRIHNHQKTCTQQCKHAEIRQKSHGGAMHAWKVSILSPAVSSLPRGKTCYPPTFLLLRDPHLVHVSLTAFSTFSSIHRTASPPRPCKASCNMAIIARSRLAAAYAERSESNHAGARMSIITSPPLSSIIPIIWRHLGSSFAKWIVTN